MATNVTAYALRIRARHSRARVLRSMIMPGYAHDPYTAESVRVLSERPPVHASGAFYAYPWGMPDVPRSIPTSVPADQRDDYLSAYPDAHGYI